MKRITRRFILSAAALVAAMLLTAMPARAGGLAELLAEYSGTAVVAATPTAQPAVARTASTIPVRTAAFRQPAASSSAGVGTASSAASAPPATPAPRLAIRTADVLRSTERQCSDGSCDR